ncbi:hypothetical protein Droror1_Dr00027421 [Drosera rotundifolia]
MSQIFIMEAAEQAKVKPFQETGEGSKSPLYDLHELVSFSSLLERHMMVLPGFGSNEGSVAEFRSSDEDDNDPGDVVVTVAGDSRRKRGTGCLVYWRGSGEEEQNQRQI